MEPYKQQFIEQAIACDALCFGEFTLKSGRVSPYFFNAGRFCSGRSLAALGRCYAAAIAQSGLGFDVLFGPAYKGIVLSAVTACALADDHDRDVPCAYNRKEVKDHGEGGQLVGAPLRGRVLILDDVITAGTAIREARAMIEAAGARVAGVVVGLDRQERGRDARSAIQEVEQDWAVPVISIIKVDDIVQYLRSRDAEHDYIERIEAYRQRYGL